MDKYKDLKRKRRKLGIRKKMRSSDKLRVTIFRSNRYLYAQIVDDANQSTVVSASSLERDLREKYSGKLNKEIAADIGKRLATRAMEKKITEVKFDRSGYKYHGKIKALADELRNNGLKF
ncbi:MAG: 50S ribosomal protein L18 [Deferribacterota bacterium]|nr:50S ribosomal protein L18 [Deferribacterota bacterium]